ncbi:carbohydrate kinase family protein [Nocardia sp. NPDC050630]|uniref:carbohydrate kinase family protein n=1 Tax=Nocardia sp. NPDC050630 TaxID=3364321 RepID=UPI00378FED68
MAAAALASMGAPVRLLSNEIGDDEYGHFVRQWLTEHHVTPPAGTPGATTPRIVVAADDAHSRTWFAHLPDVVASLEHVDLAPIATASFLYVDGYEIIEHAVLRVIEAGHAAKLPLLLNLGGSNLSEPVAAAVAGYPHLFIQTNVDDAEHLEAPAVAATLREQTGADWVIVTAGSFGAVAVSHSEVVAVLAFPVEVRHTHCAGAAFSAGLLYGLRDGWSMGRSMTSGSASGALRCYRSQGAPLPNLDELHEMVRQANLLPQW